jgi:hypothetical protein
MWNDAEQWNAMRAGSLAFRGSSHWQANGGPVVISSPEDRRPVHMPQAAQRAIDDYFEQKFGLRFRQRSLFATGNGAEARQHGVVRALTPLEPFCFCWSPVSADLFEEFQAKAEAFAFSDWLDSLQFQCDDLAAALRSGHEIMLVGPAFRAEVV